MRTPYDVIKNVMVTEKTAVLAVAKKYVFCVAGDAEKIEIGKAVEALFPNAKVKTVNVMNYMGKKKRAGRTNKMGRKPDWKKAIVTLSEGSIDVF